MMKMPVDSKRLFAPEKTIPPSSFKKASEPAALINKKGLRSDGRKLDEIRPLILNVGIITQAKGSAYFEVGNTKIIAAVYGPREVFRKKDFRIKGQLYCEFKYAPYSCEIYQSHIPNNEEKDISFCLQEALESVVLLHKFPKSRVDIFIMVLENGGGVVSHALTCAGAALANAGVEIYDIAVGCSLRQFATFTLIDPTIKEEQRETDQTDEGRITLGLMPSNNQVILLSQDGTLSVNRVTECMKHLAKYCEQLHMFVKESLVKAMKKKENNMLSK